MMPYVRLFIPELPLEKKRSLVSEITSSLVEALHIPSVSADWCTIHLFPLKADNVSVGGKLVCDHVEPSYLVEIIDRHISDESRQRIVNELKPILMRHLGLRSDQSFNLNFKFTACEARDFAIGGHFLNEYHERQAAAVPLNRRL